MRGSFDSEKFSERWVTKQLEIYFKKQYPSMEVTSGEIEIGYHTGKPVVVDLVIGDEIAVECKGTGGYRRGIGQAVYASQLDYDVYLGVSGADHQLVEACNDMPFSLIDVRQDGIWSRHIDDDEKLSTLFEPGNTTMPWLSDSVGSLSVDQLLVRIVDEMSTPTTREIKEKYNEMMKANNRSTVTQQTIRKNLKQNDKVRGDLENHISSSWRDVKVWGLKDD